MTTTPPDNAAARAADFIESMAMTYADHHELTEAQVDADIAALRPSVWMDISTAPKDGTPIITLYSLFGKDAVEVIRWSDLTYLNVEGLPNMPKPKWIRFDGKEFPSPTHWMPLPTPPKAPTP